MTMVFRVREPSMVNKVKVGDRINFVAENVDGALTIVKLEAQH
jgi:Cu/Ag efflux protein CusF